MNNLKQEYNKLLKRFYKAEEYFDRKDITEKEKERYIPQYKDILKGLNNYLYQIKDYKDEEVLSGFKE